MKANEIRFLQGRVKFINPDRRNDKPQPAPFPSAIVIFRPYLEPQSLGEE